MDWFKLFMVMMVCLVRADNWLVDTGSEPSEHNGLSPFGKVSVGEGWVHCTTQM